jgi:hypothetical protein
MMINDPIVEEVRTSRREILESYGSLRAYHNAILEKQTEYANRLVTLSPKIIAPNKRLKPTPGTGIELVKVSIGDGFTV